MYPVNASICEPLVRLGADFQPEPLLASRWEYLGDNTYRFHLRRDITMHDGRALDAASVKYSIDISIKAGSQYSFLSSESVRIADDSTVDIRPALPNLRLVDQLVHTSYSIVAAGTDPSVRPVCTGPFRFGEYVPGSHLTVYRNEEYRGEKAKPSSITFRFIPDANTRALALRSQEVDAIFDASRNMLASLKATPGIRIVTSPPGAVILLYIAPRARAPYGLLAEPALRRAMALAIDRKTLVEKVLDGYAAVINTVNPPAVLGEYADHVRGIPYDPARARRLLDSAGWRNTGSGGREKNGHPLHLSMIVQSDAVDAAIGEYVQAQLAAVGIGVSFERLDAAAFENRLNRGAFDFDIEIPNQNDANPAFLLALRWFSKSNVKSASFMSIGAGYDSLVAASLAAPDRREAQRLAADAMHVLVDEEVGAIPLAGISRIYAMSTAVRGFEPHPSRLNQRWSSVWLSR